MTANEYLKSKREEKGLTVRGFAAACDIAPRAVSNYENGQAQISSIPTAKAIRIFNLLCIDIEKFFDEYFPFKSGVDDSITQWRVRYPVCLNVKSLKKRCYNRLAKMKERGSISLMEYDDFIEEFKELFNVKLSSCDTISEEEYREYILGFNYKLRLANKDLPDSVIPRMIMDALYHTDYKLSDVGGFCSVTRQHLRGCIEGRYEVEMMRILLALKVCYVLRVPFYDAFEKNISF